MNADALPRKIGLISDTHGVLRQEALDALRDSELILHTGDVGKPEILGGLGRLAPVIAIRGNVDIEPLASVLPETKIVSAAGAVIYMLHDLARLDLDPVAAGFQIVISGHTHQPLRTEKAGVLYINAGSAGPRRFQLPVSVARLDLGVSPWQVEFVDLPIR